MNVKWSIMKAQLILFPKSGLYCTPPPNNGMNRTRISAAFIRELAGSPVIPGVMRLRLVLPAFTRTVF